jgi:hypothetical protein
MYLKTEMSIGKVIEDNLGEKTLQKINSRLLERYNFSVNEGYLEFEKFDIVLREFFGDGAIGLEKRILDTIRAKNKS